MSFLSEEEKQEFDWYVEKMEQELGISKSVVVYNLLKGKRGVIFGALNDSSIAWKVAERCHEEGAQLVLTNTPAACRMGTIDELATKTGSKVIAADATSVEDLEMLFSEAQKELGGKIDFLNEKGQGTKYFVKIKQKVVGTEVIGNIFESQKSAMSSSKDLLDCTGKKVLIVDDSDVNIRIAAKYLEQFNFTIFAANSGKQCIECVKNNNIDIIFMDHMMPEMDGVATIKALKAMGLALPPVVALTANSYDGLKNEYIAQGFTDYLSKPIVFKDLNRTINNVFKEKAE